MANAPWSDYSSATTPLDDNDLSCVSQNVSTTPVSNKIPILTLAQQLAIKSGSVIANNTIVGPFADLAALKAFSVTGVQNAVITRVFDFGVFEYDLTATDTPDDLNIVQPTVGAGRWIRITPAYTFVNASQKILMDYIYTAGGQTGGMTLAGGNSASENLLLQSTAHATKGYTRVGANGLYVDETLANNSVSIGSQLSTFAGTHMMLSLPRESTNYDGNLLEFYAGDDAGGPSTLFAKSRGSIASPTIVQSNDALGVLTFLGYDGTNYRQAAQIFGIAGNTITPGSVVSGRLEFDTADSSGNLQTVMNLDASRNTNIFGAFRPNNDAGTSGYVLTSAGAGAVPTWQPGAAPTGSAGGDLTGTYPNPTIGTNKVTYSKIQQPTLGNVILAVSGAPANYNEINIAQNALVGRGSSSNLGNVTLGAGASLAFGSSTLFRAALTGDVTASADSNTTTIAANAVTYAKFQQVAASSLVGNPTGSLANAQGITLNGTLSFTGTSLQRAALTGDVTASAGSNSTTIANNVVTYAKIQQASAGNVILANPTGSAANYAELSIGTSQLAGRGSSGDLAAITLGTNLSMSGTTLNATGGSPPVGNLKTVGTTGADYPTFADAFTSLAFNLLQVDTVAESMDYTFSGLSQPVYIYNPGNYTTSCGIYSPFQFDNTSNVEIVLSRCIFSCAYSSTKSLFENLDSSQFKVFAENCIFTNNSSVDGAKLCERGGGTAYWYSQSSYYHFPAQTDCGIDAYYVNMMQDITYGNTSTGTCIESQSGSIIGTIVQGTYDSFVDNWLLTLTNVSDVKFELFADFVISGNRCNLNNLTTNFSNNNINIGGGNVNVSNSRLNNGVIDISGGRINVSNCQIGSITDGGGVGGQFSNVQITTTAQTLVDSYYDFDNVYFPNTNTTLTIQGYYGSYKGVRVGTALSGGTLLVDTGATKNSLVSCFADTITDNGTSTSTAANVTY